MRSARLVVLALVTAGCRWLDAPPPQVAAQQRPHVVVVLGCTLRADQLSPYGAPPAVTPWLDRVARDGARFAWTIAQAPWTRAGSTAVLTGQHPSRVGVAEPAPGRNDRRLPGAAVTLAEHLHDAGYTTYGVTGNSNLNATFGFDQGFDHYQGTDRLWRDGQSKVDGAALVSDLLQQLDAHPPTGPVYLQITPVDAHKPVTVSGRDIDAFAEDGVPREVATYRAMLHELDERLEGLDAALAARGMTPQNTLWVLIGDHGEGLSSPPHHGRGHGNYLYTSAVHVPWLVRGPGVAAGAVIDGLSAQVDLVPTVLDALGLRVPADLAGESRASLLGTGGDTGASEVYTETWFRASQRAARYTPEVMCQVDGAPETPRSGRPAFADGCYRWREDPRFEKPFQDEDALGVVRAWHSANAIALRAASAEPAAMDAQVIDQLEALGYVE